MMVLLIQYKILKINLDVNQDHGENAPAQAPLSSPPPPAIQPPVSSSNEYSNTAPDVESGSPPLAPVAQVPHKYKTSPLEPAVPGQSFSSDYQEESSAVVHPSSVSQQNPTGEGDSLNCDDIELKQIVETALLGSQDNLEAARKIESDAASKFGGRFNSIVSNNEFAYVNWYGKRNCQLRINNRHSLTWED